MQSSHTFTIGSAVFDEQNLVSAAGLVPVLELAEQTGLSRLIGEHVDLPSTRVASGAVNPAGKLTTIIAGMMCGADSIDDVNVLRAGGTPRVFDEVYAPSTLGIFCASSLSATPTSSPRWPASIWPRWRGAYAAAARHRAARVPGHRLAAAPGLWAGQAGRLVRARQDRRAGAAAQGTVPAGHHVVHGAGGAGDRRGVAARRQDRLRARRRPAGQAGHHHRPRRWGGREDHAARRLRVRHQEGDRRLPGRAGRVLADPEPKQAVTKAIEAIDDDAWTPVHYPGAVDDPDTGALISDAEVAETTYTLTVRGRGRVTARLVVRRVKDANYPDALFPVWRYHPFFTNSDLPTTEADLTHRKHAIVETTFADLIDGPLAHIPSGLFAANCAWLACAVITHNLLRAAGTLAGGDHAVARGATLRRDLVTVPARFAAPARKPMLHLPAHWPWQIGWKTLWDNIIGYSPRDPTSRMNATVTLPTRHPRPDPGDHVESWCRPADHSCPHHSEPPQSCEISPATARHH